MTRRRRKIVAASPPREYLRPRRPCPRCEGDGVVDTEPITAVDQSSGERLTMVLEEQCKLCRGSGVYGKEVRA